jgi:IS5 family transposase
MNTKLHTVADTCERPIRFFMSAGRVGDDTGAAALLGDLPAAKWLLADRSCDADGFREALQNKGARACIPGRKARKVPVRYDKRRCKRRAPYDRCPKVFLSAVALAATVLFWLRVLRLASRPRMPVFSLRSFGHS